MSQHCQQPKCDVCGTPATTISVKLHQRIPNSTMIEFTTVPGPTISGCGEHPADPAGHVTDGALFLEGQP